MYAEASTFLWQLSFMNSKTIHCIRHMLPRSLFVYFILIDNQQLISILFDKLLCPTPTWCCIKTPVKKFCSSTMCIKTKSPIAECLLKVTSEFWSEFLVLEQLYLLNHYRFLSQNYLEMLHEKRIACKFEKIGKKLTAMIWRFFLCFFPHN